MKLTVKFKILPTKEQEQYLEQTLTEYINTVNNIVPIMIWAKEKDRARILIQSTIFFQGSS